MIKTLIHRTICAYLRHCGGAFHTYPYGTTGRYVAIMNEDQYAKFNKAISPIKTTTNPK